MIACFAVIFVDVIAQMSLQNNSMMHSQQTTRKTIATNNSQAIE